MKVLIFTVADYASVEPTTGKLNILGAFNKIMAKTFPVKHRAMTLVVKVVGEFGDPPNPHQFKMSLTDEDGNEIVKFQGEFDMKPVPAGQQPEFNAVMEFRDFVIKRAGTYTFNLEINQEPRAAFDMHAVELPNQQ